MIAWVPTIASTFHLGRGPRANPRGNLWSSKGRGLQWRWKTTGPVSQEKNQESAGQKGGESLKEEDERLSFRWGPLCSLGAWFAICFFRNILLKDVSHRNVQHFSSPQQLHVASGYYPGQHRYRLCPSLQKVLGSGAGLDHGWGEPWGARVGPRGSSKSQSSSNIWKQVSASSIPWNTTFATISSSVMGGKRESTWLLHLFGVQWN